MVKEVAKDRDEIQQEYNSIMMFSFCLRTNILLHILHYIYICIFIHRNNTLIWIHFDIMEIYNEIPWYTHKVK